jgi:hypothetical protein
LKQKNFAKQPCPDASNDVAVLDSMSTAQLKWLGLRVLQIDDAEITTKDELIEAIYEHINGTSSDKESVGSSAEEGGAQTKAAPPSSKVVREPPVVHAVKLLPNDSGPSNGFGSFTLGCRCPVS